MIGLKPSSISTVLITFQFNTMTTAMWTFKSSCDSEQNCKDLANAFRLVSFDIIEIIYTKLCMKCMYVNFFSENSSFLNPMFVSMG